MGSTVQSVGRVHPYGVEEIEAWVDLDSRFVSRYTQIVCVTVENIWVGCVCVSLCSKKSFPP